MAKKPKTGGPLFSTKAGADKYYGNKTEDRDYKYSARERRQRIANRAERRGDSMATFSDKRPSNSFVQGPTGVSGEGSGVREPSVTPDTAPPAAAPPAAPDPTAAPKTSIWNSNLRTMFRENYPGVAEASQGEKPVQPSEED